MKTVQLTELRARRRRFASLPDFGAFFMFFGVSGIDQHSEERQQKRFEREYYAHLATVRLSGTVTAGRYTFQNLPEEANRRGWSVRSDATASTELSDEGLQALKGWMARGSREVQLQPLT
ncbi:hypothetical protein [Deinococcus hopiensis]|uniref:Uncharacterized protein n=1 Tax=Deinococcus hopiensis KR-140 TaxID=695939 RepID=A0A1W1VGL1_9DEIO|nr:hypothetical protein [Deinococcus hopiensis]SMB92353.1 hypothetical protein SAMN00790413_01535 [Deinococcus hopiensis KR-140]